MVHTRAHAQEALVAGHKFFLSTNQVLLCEGQLPVAFVEAVDVQSLSEDWVKHLSINKEGGGAQAEQT
jgi:RNA:NAD 2'-phosphotransferase (TPT1/KptA family)